MKYFKIVIFLLKQINDFFLKIYKKPHGIEALRKLRHSKIHQECLANKIEQWKSESPSDRIYFQPKGTTVECGSGLQKTIAF